MEDLHAMSTYDYPGQPPVVTNDPERVTNLLRKGWTLRPDPPEHNPVAFIGGEALVAKRLAHEIARHGFGANLFAHFFRNAGHGIKFGFR